MTLELEHLARTLATWVQTAFILLGVLAFVFAWAFVVTAFLRAPSDPDERDQDNPHP